MADGAADLATFVGRVRGHLGADDAAWVASTSDAVESLRSHLVDAADRLSAAARRIDSTVQAGPFAVAAPDLTAWEQLVTWADTVNADLVEAAARLRLGRDDRADPAATTPSEGSDDRPYSGKRAEPGLSGRSIELGALLQSIRGEQVVDELLAAGLLVAPTGTTGWIAFAEHGAWDIEFLGRGDSTVARADVMITSDPDEILARVAARPGIDLVYTTSDVVDGLVGAPGLTVLRPGRSWPDDPDGVVVVDIGTDTEALHSELTALLRESGASDSAEAVLAAVPVLALLLVGARATARAATSGDSGDDIATGAWQQAADVVTSAGVAQLVGWASGLNLIKVPATLTFSLGRAAVRDARRTVELSGRRVARVRRLIAGVADLTP